MDLFISQDNTKITSDGQEACVHAEIHVTSMQLLIITTRWWALHELFHILNEPGMKLIKSNPQGNP